MITAYRTLLSAMRSVRFFYQSENVIFAGYASPSRLSSHIPVSYFPRIFHIFSVELQRNFALISTFFPKIFQFFSQELRKKQARPGWVPIFRFHFIFYFHFLVGIIALEPSFNNETILKSIVSFVKYTQG